MRAIGLLVTACCSCAAAQTPPPLLREFRGAWVATVDNIDWPSRAGLPVADQQRELDTLLDRARDLGLNALVFQVRPSGDAVYRSDLEPWSEWLGGVEGRAPSPAWDPLQRAVTGAHARGLELHAWFNPFRARHSKARSPSSPLHVSRAHPDWCVAHGDQLWIDPGVPAAVDWTLRVVADVVARYDIDGVHLDDYFYPYPLQGVEFADDRSFASYRARGGKLARSDYRRHNVDDLVQRLATDTHRQKPWVKVGISPFGIARPGLPAGIQAGVDQYEQLAADVCRWLRADWCDYLAPQLYWPIDQRTQSFAVLLPWWASQMHGGRHLWPGLNTSRAVAAPAPWREHEVPQQIALLRAQPGASGHVHFSFKVLAENQGGIASQLRGNDYHERALVPASPWLGGTAPLPPKVEWRRRERDALLLPTAAGDTAWLAFQVLRSGRWRTEGVLPGNTGPVALDGNDAAAIAVTAVDRFGAAGAARIVLLPAR